MLCKHRFIFGRPGEGAHAARIPLTEKIVPGYPGARGIAFVDLAMTALAAGGISHFANLDSKFANTYPKSSAFLVAFAVLMILGVILHALFCVPTALNVTLGLADAPSEKERVS